PRGYLFLCPLADLRTMSPTHFRSHVCAAYWSRDALGTEWLSMEQATNLGLPEIVLDIKVWTKNWDSSIYDGIRQFHEGKDFDPHSQDAALEAGYPLSRV
ncbi:hypothetical protein K438DRAFT_1515007, partial [Mycena galopus ATCC 62051]